MNSEPGKKYQRVARRLLKLRSLAVVVILCLSLAGLEVSSSAQETLEQANMLAQQAIALYKQGRYEEAIPLAERVVRITSSALGENSAGVAHALNVLGLIYNDAGQYYKAEPLLLKAVELRRKERHKWPLPYAVSLSNLALVYQATGRYRKAEKAYLEVMQIDKKELGEEHPEFAMDLSNLATLYRTSRQFDKAEELLLKALEIDRKLGEEHPYFTRDLTNLAEVYKSMQRFDKAEPLLMKSVELKKKAGRDRHPSYAKSLNNLAHFYQDTGQYAKAETLYIEATKIDNKLGEDNPEYATDLYNLATLYAAMGRYPEAWSNMNHSLEIQHRNVKRFFSVSSEATMRAYLGTMSGSLHMLLSLTAYVKHSPANLDTALAWTLRRKGIILDTLISFRQAQLLASENHDIAAQIDRLRFVRQQASNLPLNPQNGMDAAAIDQERRKLADEGDQIEAALHRTLAAQLAQSSEEISVDALRRKLSPGTALVEFVRVVPYDFKASGRQKKWGAAHYFAFVLTPDPRPVRLIDLQEAAPIDEAIKAVRTSIIAFGEDWEAGKVANRRNPYRLKGESSEEQAYRQVSSKLYDLVFAPVRKELGKATTVYLAPDDQLNLVSFDALTDSNLKYLIESYRLAYLTSGRDLLQSYGTLGRGTVIFADPDYNMATEARAGKAKELLASLIKDTRSTLPYKVQRRASGQARSGRWDRLPASAIEAQHVERELSGTSYGKVKRYVNTEALEDLFKNIRSPRVLHVSTHGFFPGEYGENKVDGGSIDPNSGAIAVVGQKILQRTYNPSLGSGLVLAGANTIGEKNPSDEVDDGWLTSEEIAMMQLQGTELVVLPACGSGLGVVSQGEGVYGLRRAFQNAGARTILSTLFQVPDAETGQIMHNFYKGLKNKRGKLEALHRAQLDFIAERRRKERAAHPFFWASFVLTGNPD